MIKRKCKVCGTLYDVDHEGECTVCAEYLWEIICVTHQASLVSVTGCSDCEDAAKCNREQEEIQAAEKPQSDELKKVLMSCLLYLVSLDGKFTSDEQEWVEENFGEGVADSLIAQITGISDWHSFFEGLRVQLSALSDADREYMLTQTKPLFLELLGQDDLIQAEFHRLQELMRFIEESLG